MHHRGGSWHGAGNSMQLTHQPSPFQGSPRAAGPRVVLEAGTSGTGPGAHDLVESLPSVIGGGERGEGEGAEAARTGCYEGWEETGFLTRGRRVRLGVIPGGDDGLFWRNSRARDGKKVIYDMSGTVTFMGTGARSLFLTGGTVGFEEMPGARGRRGTGWRCFDNGERMDGDGMKAREGAEWKSIPALHTCTVLL